jgi:hypothetical protein
MDFYLVPALAADVTVSGTVKVGFWGNYSGSNNNFQTQIIFYERNSAGTENWTSTTYTANYNPASAPQYYSFDCAGFQHTFAAGSSIRLSLQVSGGNGIYKAVYIDTGTNNSRVVLPCLESLEVPSVGTLDHLRNPQVGFQVNAANTTVIVQATVTDPFGGYDVRWANVTIVGPSGLTVLDNATLDKVGGTPVSFRNTYERGWNYSGAAPGRYNITVWAVDNNGYYHCFYFMNYNYGSYLATNTSFFFIGTPRFVNVKVLDSTGVALDRAEVQATVLDAVLDRAFSSPLGIANLSMQPGPYRFKVFWSGVMVASEPVNVTNNRTEDDPVVITCWVYYPHFRAIDGRGIPLAGAAVYMHYPNGTASIMPFRTDADGLFGLAQVPIGPYEVSVVWGSREVNRTVIMVAGNGTYDISCAVYYLKVRAVDPHGNPLLNAQIVVVDNTTGIVADSKLSDSDGSAEFRLARHLYDLAVYWYDALVYQGYNEPLLAGDRSIELTCWIYYLTIRSVDSAGLPLGSALTTVTVAENAKVMDSRLSRSNGEVQVRLPGGSYNITVSWQDIQVFSAGGIAVTEDAVYVATCSVHYLTVSSVDARGVPLEYAQVQVVSVLTGKLLDAQTADAGGNLTCRLPATELALAARWQDVVVNLTPSYTLEGTGVLVLNCTVYYLTVETVDSRGAPVSAAQVKLSFPGGGRLLDVQSTNESGRAVSRLPRCELALVAYWQDVLVNTTPSYFLEHDGTGGALLTLECWVYYLDVTITDSQDKAVSNAQVAFVRTSSGKTMSTLITGSRGNTTFRLPAESYTITAVWEDQLVSPETHFSLARDGSLTVKCLIFYLTVKPVDSRGMLLENATVVFRQELTGNILDTIVTGVQGTVTARLPVGLHTLIISWKDVEVNTTADYNLAAEATLTISCRVFYLAVRPVDVDGIALADAEVLIYPRGRPDLPSSLRTNASGLVTFRLPAQDYDLRAAWRAVEVGESKGYALSADQELRLVCRVYYLTVKVVDRDGNGLEGVAITVFTVRNGLVYDVADSALTKANATWVFRLPAGMYKVDARYKTTYLFTPVDMGKAAGVQLQESTRVRLVFSDFPVPVHKTNAFLVAVLVILLAAVAAATVFHIYRKFGRNGLAVQDEGTGAPAAAKAESIDEAPDKEVLEPEEDQEEEGGEPERYGEEAPKKNDGVPGPEEKVPEKPAPPAREPEKEPAPEPKAAEREPVRPAGPDEKPEAPGPEKKPEPRARPPGKKDDVELIDDILKDLDK